MARVRACVEASASLMAALNQAGDLSAVLGLIGAMDPDQAALTMILFRTEPTTAPEDLTSRELDPTSREDVQAALRQVIRRRAAIDLQLLDENLGEIGPREVIDFACGRLEGEQHAQIAEGIARDAAMLVLIDRVSRAVPEPLE